MSSNSKYITQNLRSTMNQGRLNHTTMLHVYKEMVNDLELNSVANEFVQKSKHQFGVFERFEQLCT